MADVNNLMRQHNEILDIATKINTYKTEQQVQSESFNISLLLGQLAGKIKIHMITEDRFVYPSLTSHSNPTVQTVSKRFAAEMGDIAEAFNSYKTKYMNSKEITTNPSGFINETKIITSALANRIQKENRELYPLL